MLEIANAKEAECSVLLSLSVLSGRMSWTLIYDEVTFYSPEGELGFKFGG